MLDECDIAANPAGDRHFKDLVAARVSGRSVTGGGVATAAAFLAGGNTARPFIPWGTPILGNYPAFVPGTPPLVPKGNTAADQALGRTAAGRGCPWCTDAAL